MNKLFLKGIFFLFLWCSIIFGCKSRQVSLVEARHAEQSFTVGRLSINDTLLFYPLPYHTSSDAFTVKAYASYIDTTCSQAEQSNIQSFYHPGSFLMIRHAAVQDSFLCLQKSVDTCSVVGYKSAPITPSTCHQGKGFLSYLKDACAIVFLLGFLVVIVKLLLFNQKS